MTPFWQLHDIQTLHSNEGHPRWWQSAVSEAPANTRCQLNPQHWERRIILNARTLLWFAFLERQSSCTGSQTAYWNKENNDISLFKYTHVCTNIITKIENRKYIPHWPTTLFQDFPGTHFRLDQLIFFSFHPRKLSGTLFSGMANMLHNPSQLPALQIKPVTVVVHPL